MDLNYQLSWHQLAHRLIDDLVHNPGMSLPGIQTMRKQYRVSRLTVERALGHLEDLGVVEPAQIGKKRQINLSKLQTVASRQDQLERRILFISDSPANHLPFMARDIFEAFHILYQRDDYTLDYVEAPSDLTELRTMLTSLQPRGIILYTVSRTIADVVLSLNIPAIGIGTICPGIPTFNTRYASLLSLAFKKAREAGHRRITAPIWKVREGLYEELQQELEKQFSDPPVSFSPRYNLPLVEGETKVDYNAALSEIFRYTPPTCIILSEISQYLTASSFFMKKGLRFPDDISIIFLSSDPLLEDLIPSIAHFTLYSGTLIERAFHALQDQMNGLESHEQTDLIPVWVPGGSLSAPKSR